MFPPVRIALKGFKAPTAPTAPLSLKLTSSLRNVLSYSKRFASNTKNIIITGAPGSGKGTICNKILKDFDMIHVFHIIILENQLL